MFTRDELEAIAALCRKWDAVAISDEIYEHILYDGHRHVPIATIDGMADRTVTINGLSKTYSVTGWRVGWTISPPTLTGAIRKVHDFMTVGAPAPLQDRQSSLSVSSERNLRQPWRTCPEIGPA